jgi:hypothetical protein
MGSSWSGEPTGTAAHSAIPQAQSGLEGTLAEGNRQIQPATVQLKFNCLPAG